MTTPSEYRNQGTHKPHGDAKGAPDLDAIAGEAPADNELDHDRPKGLRAFVRGLVGPDD
jgi:hypothetical protein